MKILLASFSADYTNPTPYTLSIVNLAKTAKIRFDYRHFTREPIHLARQGAARECVSMSPLAAKRMSEQMGIPVHYDSYTHLVMVDDDQVFAPDTLERLLSHDVDVVSALAFQRVPPYAPCAFEWVGEAWQSIDLPDKKGLMRVDATGFPFTVIKVEVLEKLAPEWFGYWQTGGEDRFFMRRCRDAGIPVHVDTSLVVGHLGPPPVVDERTYRDYRAEQTRKALSSLDKAPPVC